MTVFQHTLSSLPLGACMFFATGDPLATVVAMAATVLIDGDHYLDQVIERRRLAPLGEVWETYQTSSMRLAILPFHGWEQTTILIMAAVITGHWLVIGVAAGVAWHLALDQYYWGWVVANIRPGFYFFGYRAAHRFSVARLMADRGTIRGEGKW